MPNPMNVQSSIRGKIITTDLLDINTTTPQIGRDQDLTGSRSTSFHTMVLSTPVKKWQESPFGVAAFAFSVQLPAEALLAIASQAALVCIDCSNTPIGHKCHRCRRCVGDLCCSRQLGLEMIWWCPACIDYER